MILGRVVGHVWATRKHPRLAHLRLLIVQPHFWYAPPHEIGHLVAADTLGAGPGEDVLVCMGEPARRMLGDSTTPIDAAVMAIVDRVRLDGATSGRRALRTVAGTPIPEAWLRVPSDGVMHP